MTDRELLELAAKAAGIDYWVVRFAPKSAPIERLHITKDGETVEWNPLTDDGDALRLAVRLGMSIISGTYKVVCEWIPQEGDDGNIITYEQYGGDPYAATRRAIVRAAAEIGREMK